MTDLESALSATRAREQSLQEQLAAVEAELQEARVARERAEREIMLEKTHWPQTVARLEEALSTFPAGRLFLSQWTKADAERDQALARVAELERERDEWQFKYRRDVAANPGAELEEQLAAERTAREAAEARIVGLEREIAQRKAATERHLEQLAIQGEARKTAEAACAAMRIEGRALVDRLSHEFTAFDQGPWLRRAIECMENALAPDAGSQILAELRELRAANERLEKVQRAAQAFLRDAVFVSDENDWYEVSVAVARELITQTNLAALAPRPAISPEEHAGEKERK